MNLVKEIEKEQIAKLAEVVAGNTDTEKVKESVEDLKKDFVNRKIAFSVGDLVRVNVRIIEGKRERIQAYEGYVISFKGKGLTRSVKIRKNSFGVGVERTFPLYSPKVDSFVLVRPGKVRRAKLYFLRSRTGKSAQIKENVNYKALDK